MLFFVKRVETLVPCLSWKPLFVDVPRSIYDNKPSFFLLPFLPLQMDCQDGGPMSKWIPSLLFNVIGLPFNVFFFFILPTALPTVPRLHCDVPIRCRCKQGRNHNKKATIWELIACQDCSIQAIHVECGKLNRRKPDYTCDTCRENRQAEEQAKQNKLAEAARSEFKQPFIHPSSPIFRFQSISDVPFFLTLPSFSIRSGARRDT